MTDSRPEPPTSGDELAMLTTFLDHHRATVTWKLEGLSDADLRRSVVPSGWSLLGMVKHLAYVERWWFTAVFAGRDAEFPWTDDDPDADWRAEPQESAQEILDLYRAECDRSRAAIDGAALDDHARGTMMTRRGPVSRYTLRWILLHMIRETARHNGHADVARELIDGVTGE